MGISTRTSQARDLLNGRAARPKRSGRSTLQRSSRSRCSRWRDEPFHTLSMFAFVQHPLLRLALSPQHLWRSIELGSKSIWLHKLRSLLTALGIVFGVCSVIAMLAIGEGASHEAQEQIKNLGSQNIILRSVKPSEERKASENNRASYILQYGLTYADLSRIRSTIPGVSIVVPARIMRDYAWNISRQSDCEIMGTVPWYPEMRNQRVAQGRFFTDREMDEKANVCVISSEMMLKLFPLHPALGSTVRVASEYYRVIGVMEPRAKNSKAEDSTDNSRGAADRMFIPLETAKTR